SSRLVAGSTCATAAASSPPSTVPASGGAGGRAGDSALGRETSANPAPPQGGGTPSPPGANSAGPPGRRPGVPARRPPPPPSRPRLRDVGGQARHGGQFIVEAGQRELFGRVQAEAGQHGHHRPRRERPRHPCHRVGQLVMFNPEFHTIPLTLRSWHLPPT